MLKKTNKPFRLVRDRYVHSSFSAKMQMKCQRRDKEIAGWLAIAQNCARTGTQNPFLLCANACVFFNAKRWWKWLEYYCSKRMDLCCSTLGWWFALFLILCGFVLCAILHGGNWKFITLKRSAHVFCALLWEWEGERTKLQKKKNNSNHNSTQLQRQEEEKEEETDRAEEMKTKN